MGKFRDKAREVLSIVPPLGQEVKSTVGGLTKAQNGGVSPATDPLFNKITNITQVQLDTSWENDPPPGLTSCNGFVGYVGKNVTGYGTPTIGMGQFDLLKMAKQVGCQDAYIPSAPGLKPQFGDICRWKHKFHICISGDFEGNTWNHIDGGQGGKKTGYDIVKRKQDDWDEDLLTGWIDMELFGAIYADRQNGPMPQWLPTWWIVTWRGYRYYYQFSKDRTVRWTTHAPASKVQTALNDGEPGKYVVDPSGKKVTVHWPNDVIETFTYANSNSPYEENMKGLWNGKEPMSAVTYF